MLNNRSLSYIAPCSPALLYVIIHGCFAVGSLSPVKHNQRDVEKPQGERNYIACNESRGPAATSREEQNEPSGRAEKITDSEQLVGIHDADAVCLLRAGKGSCVKPRAPAEATAQTIRTARVAGSGWTSDSPRVVSLSCFLVLREAKLLRTSCGFSFPDAGPRRPEGTSHEYLRPMARRLRCSCAAGLR
jgi:hypothetical protein